MQIRKYANKKIPHLVRGFFISCNFNANGDQYL
jgi:hypothetical protein